VIFYFCFVDVVTLARVILPKPPPLRRVGGLLSFEGIDPEKGLPKERVLLSFSTTTANE